MHLPFTGICQNTLEFKNIKAEQGLPGKLLMDMIQDHQGFLWCGFAGKGVARYDGQSFKIYLPDKNDPNSLSSNFVQSLYVDSQENIWIGTWNGLNLYNRNQDNFIRFFTDKVTGSPIYAIYEDHKNRIWVGLAGLNLMQKKDTSFSVKNYSFSSINTSSISSDQIMSIFEDQENNLWVACDNGMNRFRESTKDFDRYPIPPDSYLQIQSAIMDHTGQIWLATYGQGLWQFNQHTGEYINYWDRVQIVGSHNEFKGTIRKIFEDRNRNFWIATDGSGLGLLDRENHVLTMHSHDPFEKRSLVHNNVLSLCEDNQGNLWIGTVDGISMVNARTSSIEKTTSHPLIKNGLSNNWVADIIEDEKGNFWLATEGGVNRIDLSTGQFTHYQHDPNDQNSLLSNKVTCLIKDHTGWIWSGHWELGVTRFHPNKQKFIRFTTGNPKANFLSNLNVRKIHQDRNKNFWFVNNLGVDYLNNRSGQTNHFSFTMPRDLLEDTNGRIWIGGSDGLGFVDFTKKQVVLVSERKIFSLFEDDAGFIWQATDGDGIVRLDPANGEETVIDQTNGYPGSICYGIIEDNHGYVWITSTEGIFKLDPKKGSVSKILTVPGSDNIKFRPFLKTSDGLIHFGTMNGMLSLDPSIVQDYPLPPAPVFTDFQLFNKKVAIGENSVLTTSILETKEITLKHHQNVFTLEYISPYFEEASKINYAFKLEGFDEDWREVGNQKTATYTNLNAGSYYFRVKASNQNHAWSPQEASLIITVLPALWKTWWAYSFYVVLLGLFTYFIVAQFIKRAQLKTKMQLDQLEMDKAIEMDQSKTRFFANISHEFRTPLTLILGPIKQMYDGTFKGDTHSVLGVVIRNSKRLLHLVNQLLDFSKLEAGGVTLQTSVGDLVEFMRTMFSAFESTAQQRNITYMFQSSISTLPAYFDHEKLEKAIINLLSNAFKFTKKHDTINLKMIRKEKGSKVDKGEGVVEIRVEDSGRGISANELPHIFDRFYQADASYTRQQEGTGIGLALAKELVELHYGTIKVVSKKGAGSTFIIHLPLGKSHLQKEELVARKGYQSIDATAVEALPETVTTPSIQDHQNGGLPLLLIIDDNEDMRLYLREILSGTYQVAEASNGLTGWDYALENTPDLIISDVMMPEMDGHQLCEKLKTDERTSHIPVVLLTARAGEEAKLEGLETGADDYITKPFSPVELRARVQNLIELRQKLREQFGRNLSLQPKDIVITSTDERFLQRALDILEIHRSDTDFNSDTYAHEIGMSRSQLHRKLKALTDQSTGDFIRSYRLKYARQLIEKDFGNITQVAYECGYSSPSHFAENFRKEFGVSPSEFSKMSEGFSE